MIKNILIVVVFIVGCVISYYLGTVDRKLDELTNRVAFLNWWGELLRQKDTSDEYHKGILDAYKMYKELKGEPDE